MYSTAFGLDIKSMAYGVSSMGVASLCSSANWFLRIFMEQLNLSEATDNE